MPGFTKRYAIKMLVYYERHDTALAAIQREKNMKHWPREWKVDLIVSMNPDWRDLYEEITRYELRWALSAVIAGLDPAIHLLTKCTSSLAKVMDPRVKPAGDGGDCSAPQPRNPPAHFAR